MKKNCSFILKLIFSLFRVFFIDYSSKAAATNVDKFVDIAYKYTDLQELTPEVLRTFIAKVVIHERSDKWSKSAEQKIDIYFRYIGNLTVQPVEQAG